MDAATQYPATDGRKTISDARLLELLRDGTIRVENLNDRSPVIYGIRGKPLTYQVVNGRGNKREVVEIYHQGKKRTIVVGKLVWMAASMATVPNGFCIHHKDEDRFNNSDGNLICTTFRDHDKFHGDDAGDFVDDF